VSSSEGFGAFGAGADATEVVVAVDARRVAVGEVDLNSVAADGSGRPSARFRFEHRKRGRRSEPRCHRLELLLLAALIVAGGAGALFAQIDKIVVACVTVSPGDVHSSAGRYVNLDAGWLFSRVEGGRHDFGADSTLRFTVAAVARRNGISMWTGLRVPKERADALVELGTDDMFEFASLRVRFGILDGESVFEETLG
jgi:hypothetical protein